MARSRTRSLRVGDNLEAMAALDAGSVELVYLDPPFNSGRTYDAIVAPRAAGRRHRSGAFGDQWTWSAETEQSVAELGEWLPDPAVRFVADLTRMLGHSDLAAYLVMMSSRLGAAHTLLSDSGSIYLHCDPAASHYLKLVLDQIFGPENFRNEIIWKRTHAHSSSRRYGSVHDVILFYSKSARYTWNPVYSDYKASYIEKHFTHEDEKGRYQLITCTAPGDRLGTKAHYNWRGKYPPPGRHWAWKAEQMEAFDLEGRLVHSVNGVPRLKRYTDDGAGVPVQDLWTDINRLDAHSEERVGYDTQKPLAILDRIVSASSSPGDVVLDPFCGTGTTVVAAERLGRQWIGIDSSVLAASISLARVRQEVHLKQVALRGFPESEKAAQHLYDTDATAFGAWGTSMLGTLADRKNSNESVTIGSGKLKLGSRMVQLQSWVPIHDLPVGAVPAPRRRASRLGFVLQIGKSHDGLVQWVEQRTKSPVHAVTISELVDSESLKRGLSERIVTAASDSD